MTTTLTTPFALRTNGHTVELLSEVIWIGAEGHEPNFSSHNTQAEAMQAFVAYAAANNLLIDPEQTGAQMAANAYAFFNVPDWIEGETFTHLPDGTVPKVQRVYNNIVYTLIIPHTTQSDYTPPTVPALWGLGITPGIIPEWSTFNPNTIHLTIELGDLVQHNGKVYSCINLGQAHREPGSEFGHHGWKYEYDI